MDFFSKRSENREREYNNFVKEQDALIVENNLKNKEQRRNAVYDNIDGPSSVIGLVIGQGISSCDSRISKLEEEKRHFDIFFRVMFFILLIIIILLVVI